MNRRRTIEEKVNLGAKILKLLQGGDTKQMLCERFGISTQTVNTYVSLVATKNFYFNRKGNIVFK